MLRKRLSGRDNMNRKIKIVSFMMMTVFLLCTLVSGKLEAVYAATSVKYADENTMYNQKYKYNFKITKNTKATPWGFSDNASLHDKYDPNGVFDSCMKSLKNADEDKGKFGMLYTNVGSYSGESVDLKLTVMNWGQLADNYVTEKGDKITPYLVFRKDVIEIQSVAVRSVRVRFTFLKSGTSEVLSISGHATLSDLDGGQGFGFPDGCGIKEAYVLRGNSHLKIDGDKIIAADNPHGSGLSPSDKKGWSTVLFDDSNFYLDFYGLYDKSMFEEPWTIGIHDNGTLAASVYQFTPYAIGNFDYKAPSKRVGSQGTSWSSAKNDAKVTQEAPYIIPGTLGTGKFDYIIMQEMSPNNLTSFTMQDTLEGCLVYDSMKITNSEGSSVTGRFDIKQSGQKITASAKSEYLSKESFTNNEIYYFHITVHRDKNAAMSGYKSKGSADYSIPNKASVSVTFGNGEKDTQSTKDVWAGYSRIPISADSTDIEKRVGDSGVTWDLAAKHEEETEAFRIHEYEAFDYLLKVPLKVEGNELSEFRITDTMEECLDIDNTSKVKITDIEGEDVTGSFEIKIGEDNTGHKTITCQAAAAALKNESFWTNQEYTVRMTVHRKHTQDIKTSMKEWLDRDGCTFRIPNQASVYIKDAGDKVVQKDSNKSWVWDTIRSELQIEKTCIPYDGWEIGSEVEYAVKVSQVRQDGYAVDTEVWDYDLPEGLKLVPSSIKVTDNHISEGTLATVKPEGSNGWKAACPRMQYGDYFVVSFRAKADETVNGKDTINTAYATAVNFTNEDDEKITVSDSAEAWVNTPCLEINKLVDKYEHETGDVVKYTVIVKNTKDYTVAKNVVVSDISLPDGMKLAQGQDSVQVTFSPDSAGDTTGWPVADGTAAIRKEDIPNSVEIISNNKNTWTVKSKYLSSDANMTIEFTCEAMEDINGIETQNQASVTADNAAKDEDGNPVVSWDDAKVYVNTVDLTIDKTASKYEWQIGEDVEYTIEVSNCESKEGTIARNVLIRDIEIPEGLELESIDNVLVDGVPVTVIDKIEGPQDIPNQLDEQFYESERELDNPYILEAEGRGFFVSIPNLPQNETVMITFPCKALQVAEGEESWEWINKASVTADNQRGHETEEDDAEIYINTAQLTIDKTMINPYYDKEAEGYDNREPYEFRVGEEIEYRITVNNIQKNSIARNVMIQDISLPEGFTLAEGENAVTMEGYLDTWNNPVAGTPDEPNQLDPDHYRETETLDFTCQIDCITGEDGSSGFTVAIDNLPCTTGDILNPQWQSPLVITYRCVASEQVNGYKIINTASVTAENAEEKKDSEMVWINSPLLNVVKKADKKNYKLGDIITYEVTATQNQIGCLARNVTFEDLLLTEGVKLQKNSIVLMDETGKVINSDEYDIEIWNDRFTIASRRHLVCPKGNYPLAHLDANGQVIDGESYNPLGIMKQKKLVIEYQAAVVDESLAGKTVDNKIVINSDEKIPGEDEAKVSVNSPILNIDKVSDKEIYHVGETGIYKLTVTQLREDVTALNVQIRDFLQTEGVRIVEDSLVMEFNGKEFEPENLDLEERGFTIDTGKNLTDADKIEIVYAVLFEAPELDGTKVNNVAAAWGDNTPEEEQENVVLVEDLNPILSIEKSSDKLEYEIGETGHYTLQIQQKTKDAVARNVIIKDALQIAGAEIQPDTIQIRNSYGTILEAPEIDAAADSYTIHTGADLAYGDYFTVNYDVLFADEALGGKDIVNIARTTADNARPETRNDTETPVKIGDGLTVLKTCSPANGSVVANGDMITYSITVTNTSGEDKKTILVKDGIPAFTEFVEFADDDADTTAQLLHLDEKEYASFIISNLAAGSSRTVGFRVKAVDASEDDMIVNIAQARETIANTEDFTEATWKSDRFRSTNETVHFLDTQWASDSNMVTIGTPGLTIEKLSDKDSYNVGDTGKYTLTVSQTKQGAVSKNVVISDKLDNEYAEIRKRSIKVTDGDGKELKEAEIIADERSFTIKTHRDLAYEESFTVTYEVSFRDKALEGMKVYNVAVARDDTTKEGEEPTDDNEVEISKAVLAIEKTSDKYEYQVGETALYELNVKQTVRDKTAQNVMITDTLANQDARLDEGSIVIKDTSGQLVRKADINAAGTGFTIETNTDLDYGESFTVTYKVIMEKKTLVGHEVKNTAKTWADNAEKVNTDHAVIIKGAVDPQEETPLLNIEKTASKSVAKVGDNIHYTVTVTQTRENAAAKMVTIRDSFAGNSRGCVSLIGESIKLSVDGTEIKTALISVTAAGLDIQTGHDLAYAETMKLEYDVKAVKASDSQIINTAVAGASNASDVKAEYGISIPIEDAEKPTPTPTVSPTPTATPKAAPTSTPKASGSSSISGGKTASAAKTGDERPLGAVGVIAVLAIITAAGGFILYRRSARNSRRKRRKP